MNETQPQSPAVPRSPDRPLLVALVGLPRSGKSTWAKASGEPVVNPDSIRLALHGRRYVESAEPFVWATAKLMVHSLFLAGHPVVILDATNVTRKRRREWYNEIHWRTVYNVIPTSMDECIRRAQAANDTEIVPVIKRMWEQFEPLDETETPLISPVAGG